MAAPDDELTPLTELFAPESRADPYPGYRAWRETSPIHQAGGMLVLTRHEDCTAALRDPAFGHAEGDEVRAQQAPLTDENGRAVRSFLGLNPPDHTRLRRLVSAAFTPRRIARLAPRIEVLARQRVDEMLGGGPVDLIGSLASPLPVIVISELLGVPDSDRDLFVGWSHAMASGLDPDFLLPQDVLDQQVRARAEFVAYFRELIAERRRRPADDLLSDLVSVRDRGDALTEEEMLATCVLLLIAGHETTVNLIGNGTLALLRNPGEMRRLRAEPELAEPAIEEMLRFDSPVQLTLRNALHDTEVGGKPVSAGTFALVMIGAANRDPQAHPEPDRFDIGRDPTRHLAFGQGIHFCLGSSLARLEGRTVFAELARRNASLQLADEPEWKTNIVLRGMSRLLVEPA